MKLIRDRLRIAFGVQISVATHMLVILLRNDHAVSAHITDSSKLKHTNMGW